jgi:N-acetylneuraminate lyase
MVFNIKNGATTALLTPYLDDGAIDYTALGRLVRLQEELGSKALFVCGGAGGAREQNPTERKQILEHVISNTDLPVIAHVGFVGLDAARDLTVHAMENGVVGIAAMPPNNSANEALFNYVSSLADIGPFVFYYFPRGNDVELNLRQLTRVLSIPGVVGIKYTDLDTPKLGMLGSTNFNTFRFCGYDENFLATMGYGVTRGIGNTYNALADVFNELCDSYLAKRTDHAQMLQMAINQYIFESVFPLSEKGRTTDMGSGVRGVISAVKYSVEFLHGIHLGIGRYEPGLSEMEKDGVRESLSRIMKFVDRRY